MRVTFLGTGIMGAPMARRIAEAGHDVTVWNRTIAKAQPLAEHGAHVADDAAAATTGAEVVVTMLTDGDTVEEVMRVAAPAAPDRRRCSRPAPPARRLSPPLASRR